MIKMLENGRISLPKFLRRMADGALFSVPKKIRRRVRESGPLYTFFMILNHCVPQNIFKFIKMSVREIRLTGLHEICADSPPDSPNVRWATPHDTDLLRQAGYGEDSLKRRFDSACRAVIYEENGVFIGVNWYAPPAMAEWEEYHISLALPRASIWNFEQWVDPIHRGKGIAGKILKVANATLHAEGYRYVYGVIVTMNRNSIRANGKAGSREVGHLFFLRILNFVYFRTQGNRYFGRFDAERKFTVPLNIANERGDCSHEHSSPLR